MTIEFDEIMCNDGTWTETDYNFNSDDYAYCEKFKAYCCKEYDVYLCWNKGFKEYGCLYRVKKNKVCSKCGQVIK